MRELNHNRSLCSPPAADANDMQYPATPEVNAPPRASIARQSVLAGLVLAIATLLGAVVAARAPAPPAPTTQTRRLEVVDVAVVKSATALTIPALGSLVPSARQVLRADAPGTVVKCMPGSEVATSVRAGDTICTVRWDEGPGLPGGRHALKADIDGVVQERSVRPGQRVNPGDVIAVIIDLKVPRVEVRIPQTLLPLVRLPGRTPPGASRQATVRIPGHEVPVAGELEGIALNTPRTPGFVHLAVILRSLPDEAHLQLTPGMLVTVELPAEVPPEVLELPSTALDGHRVWAVNPEHRLDSHEVDEAFSLPGRAFIRSSSLEPGALVVAMPPRGLDAGDEVEVRSLPQGGPR